MMSGNKENRNIETETAHIIQRDDRIVKLTFKDNAEISFQNALDLLESLTCMITSNSLLIVDGSRAKFVSTRAQAELFKTPNISAIALIAPKWSDRITAENILKANQPIYPVMIFESENEAVSWLKQHV